MSATQTLQGPDKIALAGDNRVAIKKSHAHPGVQFVPYTAAKRQEWDQFVFSNPQAACAHLSSELILAEENSSTTNRSIMMYEHPGRLVGILPLHQKTSSALKIVKERELASRGGPLFRAGLNESEQNAILDKLIEHLKQLARSLRADRILVSYPSSIDERLAVDRFGVLPLRKYGFVETNEMGTYLDLRRTEADLFSSLDKNCRYSIRKAEKDGVQISKLESRDEWLACETLNAQTFGKLKHSKRRMEIVWDEFIVKGHAHAFVARHEGRVASVGLIQSLHKCAYYWIAYNARPLQQGANNYLLWRGILHAKELGMSTFLVGSYYLNEEPKTQAISDFKRRFGGTPYYVLGGSLTLKRNKRLLLLLLAEFYPHIVRPIKRGRSLLKKALNRTEG